MKPKMEAWAHGVKVLSKISKRHPPSDFSELGILLQLEWYYQKRNVPGAGTMMGTIVEALIETFFPAVFRGEEVDSDSRKS